MTLTWSQQPGTQDTELALALLGAAASADGVDPVSEAVVLALRHSGAAEHLFAHDGDGLAGYAQLNRRGDRATAELAVHPAHRSHGIGTELARALRQRAGSPLWAWAHGEHPAALHLAGRFGMRRARELWQLRRNLADPLPSRPLPDGLALRAFLPGRDEDAVVAVNNRAFAWHPEQSGWQVDELVVRQREPWFDPNGFLLAVDDADRLSGFHWTKVHPDGAGEVYVLAVDPAAQGTGLGVALTVAGLEHLACGGSAEALLYTEADNESAVRMYDKLGFAHHHTDAAFFG